MAANSLPDYEYSPITPGSRTFRAIRLLSPVRSWHDLFSRGTLRIEIEDVQLDAERAYECLSYTWGVKDGQRPDRRVIIETAHGQRQLFIHQPLESALFQLVENSSVRDLIFVDQICLNQSNHIEKAEQVPLMRDIYANSARTLIWIGAANRQSDIWFDFVKELHADGTLSRLMGPNRGHFMHVFDAVMDPSIPTSGAIREDTDDLRRLMDQHAKSLSLKALADVFGRPWFTRLWVIQEICLPPDVMVMCGTRSLCLDCFRGGNLFFSVYTSYMPRQIDRKVSKADVSLHWDVLKLIQGFMRIYQERRAIHLSGKRQNSLDTVLRYSVVDGAPKVGAAWAEDRIYGVMGLMAYDDDLHKVEVRYGDVVGVYTEFAALQLQKNLDVLCFAQFPKSHDLPSWVPDWSTSLNTPRGYTKLEEPRFAAGTAFGRKPQAKADLITKTLIAHGMVVDRIRKVGERELEPKLISEAIDRHDDKSARLFFDEIDELLKMAKETPGSRFQHFNTNDERREDVDIRLADRGLSEHYLRDKEMSEESIRSGLRAAKAQVAKVGQMLLNVEEQVRSYHMDRIFKTVGIVPWYWVPGGEVDLCCAMATDPLTTSINWAKAAPLFVVDVVGLCLASWFTVGFSHLLEFRKRYQRLSLHPSKRDEALRKHGLDANVEHSEAVSTLNDFILKNTEQRLYVTEHGHIGLGPRTMQPDDAVVVLSGGTVPHVLRSTGLDEDGDELWEYLGEAYCDGIMDGELLGEEGDEATEAMTFKIR